MVILIKKIFFEENRTLIFAERNIGYRYTKSTYQCDKFRNRQVEKILRLKIFSLFSFTLTSTDQGNLKN